AKVTLYVNDQAKSLLESIQENLQQIFIVSGFEVAGGLSDAPKNAVKFENTAIVVSKAEGETCDRCWTVTPDVGQIEGYDTLCPRCAEVVKNNYSHLA
uniref:zinc finger domain-containing protein n=1 Tax=Cytobacillus sp. TaxID=2675269 RepID=UPI0035161E9B